MNIDGKRSSLTNCSYFAACCLIRSNSAQRLFFVILSQKYSLFFKEGHIFAKKISIEAENLWLRYEF